MKEKDTLEEFIEKLLTKAREIQLPDSDIMSIFISNVATQIRKSLIVKQPATLSKAFSQARLKYTTMETCKDSEELNIDEKLNKILTQTAKKEDNTSTKVNAIADSEKLQHTVEENTRQIMNILAKTDTSQPKQDDCSNKINAVTDKERLQHTVEENTRLIMKILAKTDTDDPKFPTWNKYSLKQ